MIELIICFGAGVFLAPLSFLLFQSPLVFVLVPAVYLLGGYLIGKKFSKDNWMKNSITFGIGTVIWGLIFTLVLAWQPGSNLILTVLTFTTVPTMLSVVGAKAAINKT